ncbi:Vanillyl-alcohol oxidase C-terminal subdomain 2 [Penicillium expansum]|nr:Vanillyl-alcohol oxidase C-terminal subdomain 2 [Penicillium expansum]
MMGEGGHIATKTSASKLVSEEAYDSLVKLLRRFVPEEELPELTVESISGYLEQMNNYPASHVLPNGRNRDTDPSDAVLAPNSRDDLLEHDLQQHNPQELTVPSDDSLFQEELGCMTLDSLGKYRKSTLDLLSKGNQVHIELQDMSVPIPQYDGIILHARSASIACIQIHALLSH